MLTSQSLRGAILQGARFLLSAGVAVVVAAPFIRLSTYVTSNTLERGLYIPEHLRIIANVATSSYFHVATHATSLAGWYLSIFSLFCALVEVFALNGGKNYQAELLTNFRQSISVIWPTLRVAGAAVLLALSVDTCWSEKAMRRVFAGQGKGSWLALEHFLVFDFNSQVMLSVYLVSAVVIISLIVLAIWFAWTFLFWGFLWALIACSRRLARLIGVQTATAPLASIIMTLIGMGISLL